MGEHRASAPGAELTERTRRRFGHALVFLLAGGLFIILGGFAHRYDYFQWDISLTRWIQTISLLGFHELMLATSWMGTGWSAWWIAILTGAVFLIRKRFAAGAILLAGVGLGALANRILKSTIGRPRPTDDLIEVLIEYPNLSFPSGHVVFFVQFFGFLLYLAARSSKGWQHSTIMILICWPIALVGISRVYLGAHWPSDVLGGYLVGGIALGLMLRKYEQLHRSPVLKQGRWGGPGDQPAKKEPK